ncbi:hypothetical protein DV702_14785 [Sporosarcina sp. PTS2304]|uniref:hypothetical protein n=1 Tax=Sporosarcina sp. PTS2304 TaxID=2283194 RepID=UPI000E0DF1BB|nr:hypothetical protein [Sporosarcina sp. PTS2304]AXI00860.1 hypothetical protein DV702_14785 [Sporosarcina sp. PTS2304]
MKKQLISTLGALMLTTGALHGVTAEASQLNTNHQPAAYTYYQGGYQAAAVDVTTLPEYATVASKVDVTTHTVRVVEDQKVIRKMILNDSLGRTQYKTVFNKTTNHLKIINTRGAIVFNQVITEQPAPEVKPSQPTTPSTPVVQPTTPEYDALAKTVDLTGYTTRVVTDNYNTRVTIFSDAQRHAQYKTILVKRTGAVKIIRL